MHTPHPRFAKLHELSREAEVARIEHALQQSRAARRGSHHRRDGLEPEAVVAAATRAPTLSPWQTRQTRTSRSRRVVRAAGSLRSLHSSSEVQRGIDAGSTLQVAGQLHARGETDAADVAAGPLQRESSHPRQ